MIRLKFTIVASLNHELPMTINNVHEFALILTF